MADQRWQELRRLLEDLAADYTGRIEYGNLRLEVYDGREGSQGGRIAMAYETPGGSTNQFGISFDEDEFHMLDASAEEVLKIEDPSLVASKMRELIESIPEARLSRLHQDIDQLLDAGASRPQILEELNRLLRLGTEFRGGSLTVEELTDACRYLMQRTDGE